MGLININKGKTGLAFTKNVPSYIGEKELIKEFSFGYVLDICLNESSEMYVNDSSIGIVIFSLQNDSSFVNIAKPMFSSIRDYPIIGEMIRIGSATYTYETEDGFVESTDFFYEKVPVKNTIKNDSPVTSITKNDTLFDEFINVSKSIVNKILHVKIGEKTIESRLNSVIKLGYKVGVESEDTHPEIKIINNIKESTENFDEDGTSIILTTGEDFSFSNNRVDEDIYKAPINNSDVLAMNSDRIIINSKKHIDILAEDNINLHSNKYNQIAKTSVIKSSDIRLGGEDAENGLVLFDELNQLLSDILDAITQITVVVPGVGVSSVPTNSASFLSAKIKLAQMKSKIIKIKE